MLNNKSYSLTIMLLALSLSFTLMIADDKKASDLILVSEENPPYVYINKEGKYAGSSIDYLIPILNKAKLSFEMKIAPWNRAMTMTMKSDNVLIFPISRISEREDDFTWLLRLHSMHFKLYGLAGKVDVSLTDVKTGSYKFVCANHTIQCLGLKKLGIPEKSIVRISNVDDIQMSKMVMRGRVDFMLITEVGLRHQLIDINLDPNNFIALDNYNFESVEYIAGSKNFDPLLAKRIINSAKQFN